MYKNIFNFNKEILISNRIHIGHKKKNLNNYINSYVYLTLNKINLFNINKIWFNLKFLYCNLSEIFLYRNSIFIIGTNKNLPMEFLLNKWLKKYPIYINDFNSFYISGFVDKIWIKGLFSNWKIFYNFINYIKFYNLKKKREFKYEKYFPFLKGIINLKRMPLPNFFLFLDKNEEALYEIKQLKTPLIGIIDTDMNPKDFLFKFYGNNDSVETLDFFFELIYLSIINGRLKEQQLFFSYFINKLKALFLLLKKKKLKKKELFKEDKKLNFNFLYNKKKNNNIKENKKIFFNKNIDVKKN